MSHPMSRSNDHGHRTLGFWGATGVGVGAIVGGGVLALAGVAFATTGPGAIVAFALNGGIALLTALSFAELASRFPESGGTYTYARKVLTVEAAFAVGWVVWFASVVAAVLYALGFAVFLIPFLEQLVRAAGATPPGWLGGRFAVLFYALAAVLVTRPPSIEELRASFQPFLESGPQGLFRAMGYTFIALQGFDLIAAVGGEVKRPEQTIPRAMFLSLGVALLIYLPLLFLIVAVGSPGQPIAALAGENPEILVAVAARNFLGPAGYWLIIVAGLLAMLSALHANLLAASRFARTMASDRTLPRWLDYTTPGQGTPVRAIQLTGVTVVFLLIAVADVATAGAIAGLIFLVSFTLVHGIAYLVRRRAGDASPFQAPAFPLIPAVGGMACLALGMFQVVSVPSAGVLAALWLSLGAILYVTQFAHGARVVDAASEARDPQLMRFRGRSPLTLVPIANPASTETLVTMAHALATRSVSRVLLLSVVGQPDEWPEVGLPPQLVDAQSILGGALAKALSADLRPEALITISDDPWKEIARVAAFSSPESLLVGVGTLDKSLMAGPLERLIGAVDADVVILAAPSDWDLSNARKILVPSGGARFQSPIRARLLGSLAQGSGREVTFLRVLPRKTNPETVRQVHEDLRKLAQDEAPSVSQGVVVMSDDMVAEVVERSAGSDLVILGLQRIGRRRKVFGEQMLEIAQAVKCPLLMINQRS